MRLNEIAVRNLPAPATGSKVFHDDTLTGFGVRVTSTGVKAFVLTHGANRERLTIGRYPIVGLAKARDIARKLLAERTLGRHQTPKTTLGEALDLFAEQHTAKLAPRTHKEIARLFTRYLTKFRPRKLADITTQDVTNITDKIAPSEGEHLHRACKTFFRWCVRRRLLQHSPIEGLELPSMWKPRERVLSDEELCAVWHAVDQVNGTFCRVVKLLILTGQRRGEIGQLKQEWIAENTITIPAQVSKNRRAHTFPIGMHAVSLAEPITFNGWAKCKAQLDKRIAIARGSKEEPSPIPPWTLHDLRRTFATGLQRLGVRIEVIEALLNHVSGTRAGIVGVYQRHHYQDEMREAVGHWENHLKSILAEA